MAFNLFLFTCLLGKFGLLAVNGLGLNFKEERAKRNLMGDIHYRTKYP